MKWTTDLLYERLKSVTFGGGICVYTPEICEMILPKIEHIERLKKEQSVCLLAHSYVVPEIIMTVADFVGDSYELSKRAKESDKEKIVFAAVKFMAETAKLLNPQKDVLIPSKFNGCSLADSITGKDVRELRKKYPDYTFICYINTTVDVKAQCDISVTSSNVYDIIEHCGNDKIYFLPDKLMALNAINEMKTRGIEKDIQYWDGVCYVHEEYSPGMINNIRRKYEHVKVLAHPECDETILEKADYVGSTSQMVNHVKETSDPYYFLLTECGLTGRLQTEVPDKKFVGTCTMCKYMKSNSLDSIIRVLEKPEKDDFVHLDPTDIQRAGRCVERMFELVANTG